MTEGWKERRKDNAASASNGPVIHMPRRLVTHISCVSIQFNAFDWEWN